MLKQIYQAILDTVFPPKCPICHTYVEGRGQWCSICLGKVVTKHYAPLDSEHVKFLDQCIVLCHYRQGLKQLIHAIKYYKKLHYIAPLIWLLNREVSLATLPMISIVVPVPLHADRLKERGFNQSEKIFHPWANQQGLEWQNILIRTKATVKQHNLTIAERKQNIKDAFTIIEQMKLKGKTVLLVDDIFTTGATMNECAKMLKQAGAVKVIGLTIASDA
ncbi:MAG: phosphoribosyltransferase [Firmicutes bacterium]|nr:phosphoribosyltransferase [Bacillota bacterium]